MNQLSKEAIEAIERKEQEYFKDKSFGWSVNHYADFQQKARSYKEGMIQALTNPEIFEKAGLIKDNGEWFPLKAAQYLVDQNERLKTQLSNMISLDDAMGFAEWSNKYRKLDKIFSRNSEPVYMKDDDFYTLSELFQIYKQQKP